MTHNSNTQDPAAVVDAVKAPPPPSGSRRKVIAVTAGVAAVALVAVAGFAVPRMVHAAQVAEYRALTEETNRLYVQAAENLVTRQATVALTEYHLEAAHGLADALTVWGSLGSVAVSAEAAVELREAGVQLAEGLEGVTPTTDTGTADADTSTDADAVVPVLREAHQARMAADKEAAAAEAADGEATPVAATASDPVPVLPLALTVAHAAELLGLTATPVKAPVVADSEVTGVEVAAARKLRDTAAKQAAASDTQAADATSAHQQVTSLVEGAREALTRVASEAPAQASLVVAEATYASTDWHSKVTSMADAAAEIAEAKQATIAELTGAVQSYVDAASGALAQHAELAAEAAAIAAAQAGAGGYTDPTTGEWREVPSQVWSNYGGGSSGWSGGGGSWSGGGDSGGSSGGGSSVTPEQWFIDNCRWGYVWSPGWGGRCHPEPDLDDDFSPRP